MIEDKAMFDAWSFQHFTAGAVVGSLGLFSVGQYFVLHSLFEVWENTIGVVEWQKWGWRKYDGDSYRNILGDTICGVAGFYLMDKITNGKVATPVLLATVMASGAIIGYNHPDPVDEEFLPDKIKKGIVTVAAVGLAGMGSYLVYTNLI